jgi:hypothetical protein
MAFVNVSKPSGLSPVRYLNGAKYDGKGQMYAILAADTNPYFPGDLVTPQNTGDAQGNPCVTLATAGNPAVGVIVAVGTLNTGTGYLVPGGPYVNPNNLAPVNRPSGAQSVVYYALVSDDPNIIYEIQEGGAATNLTTAACNNNANILYAAPATGVNVSGTTINNASVATTATLNLKILRLSQRVDNHFSTSPATGGAGQKWEVIINNHVYRGGTLGI